MPKTDLDASSVMCARPTDQSAGAYRSLLTGCPQPLWRYELAVACPIELPAGEQVRHFYEHAYLAECNHAAARACGFARAEDLSGQRLGELWPPTEANLAYLRQFVESGCLCADTESHEVDGEGRERYFSHTLFGVVENNCLVRVWATRGDVTRFRLAERESRRGEERFRELLENANDIVYTHDLAGNFTSLNRTGERVTGYAREEALCMNIAQVVAPEHLALARRMLAHKAGGDDSTVYELDIVTKDGGRVPLEVSTRLIYEGGRAAGVQGIARDITERRRAEEQLRRSEERYELASRATNDVIYDLNLLTGELGRNEGVRAVFGYAPQEVRPDLSWWEERLHPQDAARVPRSLRAAIDGGRHSWSEEYRFRRADGLYAYVFDRGYFVRDERGLPVRMIGAMVDVTARREAEEQLRRSEESYRDLVENAKDIIYTTDLAGRYTSLNRAGEEITGYTREEASRMTFLDVVAPEQIESVRRHFEAKLAGEESAAYETEIVTKDGRRVVLEVKTRLIYRGGAPAGVQGSARDVTERKLTEERLLHEAFHDRLTGLPNRAFFIDRLERVLGRARRGDARPLFAVLFMDLDRFKLVNDSLGHVAGDGLLIEAGRRVRECLRAGDTVARLGGDAYIILLEEVEDASDAARTAERVLASLSAPVAVTDGVEVFPTASVGIVIGSAEYEAPGEVLRDADTALHRAKREGKARYQVFDREMHARAVAQLKTETDLRRAVERGEFVLHFQPVVSLDTARLVGFEALVRWRHPKRGLVYPNDFIHVAEEAGIVTAIDRWVLREACAHTRAWQRLRPAGEPLTVSVNLSPQQLAHGDTVRHVAGVLEELDFDPRCLKLEIIESCLMGDLDATAHTFARLRALGVDVHLDDFGTGYSSLSYLHRLRMQALKIDRAFVSRIREGGENAEIARAVVALAQGLGMHVIAEGIETERQRSLLLDWGCRHGQGYHFSRPLDAEAADELIRRSRREHDAPPRSFEPRDASPLLSAV